MLFGICLLVYVGANTLGLMTLPGLMVAELLPQRVRGIGGGCNFFLFNLLIFITTKVFPMVKEAVGVTGIFTIFGTAALLEGVFYLCCLTGNKRIVRFKKLKIIFRKRTYFGLPDQEKGERTSHLL